MVHRLTAPWRRNVTSRITAPGGVKRGTGQDATTDKLAPIPTIRYPLGSQEAEAHMQWEYEIVQVSDVGNLQKTLNVKGEMGWEAVGAFVSGRSPAVILKREKASKSN